MRRWCNVCINVGYPWELVIVEESVDRSSSGSSTMRSTRRQSSGDPRRKVLDRYLAMR